MAIAEIRKMIGLGMPPELAKVVDESASSGGLQIGTTGTTAMAGNKVPTATDRGGVLQQAAIANAAAAPTQAEFNAVLAALRAAGVLAT